MLADLQATVANNTTSQITSAGVVLPLSPSQDLESRFVTAAPALGLNELKLNYPASIRATYALSTPDFYACSEPEHGVLTVDYSDAGLVATRLVDQCGFINEPMKPWSTEQMVGIDKIILTGSHGAAAEIHHILTSALTGGAYEGRPDEMLVPQRGSLDPLYIVSASAARGSLRWQQDLWVD
ncbi:hypothetical protein LTR95_007602 [Oleoguttula sp. CCFEE 5521]